MGWNKQKHIATERELYLIEDATLQTFNLSDLRELREKLAKFDREIIGPRGNINIVLCETEYTILLDNEGRYVAYNSMGLKPGQLVWTQGYHSNEYLLVDDDMLGINGDKEFSIDVENLRVSVLTAQAYKEHIQSQKEEYAKSQAEEKSIDQEQDIDETTAEGNYIKNGVMKAHNVEIDANRLKTGSWELLVKKDFNEWLEYRDAERVSWRSAWEFPNLVLSWVQEGKIKDFTVTNTNIQKSFQFHIEDRNTKVNGVKINKSALPLIIRSMNKDIPDKKIKLYSSLGKTRAGVMDWETIEIGNMDIKLPISIDFLDKDGMSVEINGETREVPWEYFKDLFYITPSYSRTYIRVERFRGFMKRYFGKTQQEVYSMLRLYLTAQNI